VLAAAVAIGLWVMHGRLLAVGFDRAAAGSAGISPGVAEAALYVLLALAVVVAVQGLGNLLVVAVFVGPAAAARQLTERVAPMIALASGIAVLAGVAGLYLSYYAGTAGGASIALAIVAAYLMASLARTTIGRA
jgi:ABC-type Mn2+/Zn2+ transport system permease subunit